MELTPVSQSELARSLQQFWGITALEITPVRLGRARNTWAFRASSAEAVFFLKLKCEVHEAGIAISRMLADCGVNVSTPLLSIHGHPWERVDQFGLLVFPFVVGAPIMMAALDATDWQAIGTSLRAVHDAHTPEPVRQLLMSETFVPSGEDLLARIQKVVSERGAGDAVQEQLLQLWLQWGSLPTEFFTSVQRKGHAARLTQPKCCLCHGDFQSGNILRSSVGEITLIDWDDPVWAPPECDLMFVPPEYRPLLETGYGPYTPNEASLAFLSANWILQEALDCADRILFTAETNAEERQWALRLSDAMLKQMAALGTDL